MSFKGFVRVFENLKTFHHQQRWTGLPIPGSQDCGSIRAFFYDPFNISIHPYNQVHNKNNLHHQEREREKKRHRVSVVCFKRILDAVVTCHLNGKWTKASTMRCWLQIQRLGIVLWQTWIIQQVKKILGCCNSGKKYLATKVWIYLQLD